VSETPGDHPGVLIFPPLLFALCLVGGTVAHLVCPYRLPLEPWARGGGLAAGIAAVLFAIWGERTMKAAGTNVRPNLPALAIVSNGPFAFTRNPLYLAVLTLFAGIGVGAASPPFLAVLAPLYLVLHFGVVLREERYLEAKFGDTYRGYKTRVRRWI
jgi:protein-S-isoprenylcysteine O-methyltransferase Ste14